MYLRELQADMWELVNMERGKFKLPPLQWNSKVGTVAYHHCHEIMRFGRLFHQHPITAKNVNHRLDEAGISWSGCGENCAFGNKSVPVKGMERFDSRLLYLHFGLLNSPQHRANLLHPDFREIGIAIIPDTMNSMGGENSIIITQVFRA